MNYQSLLSTILKAAAPNPESQPLALLSDFSNPYADSTEQADEAVKNSPLSEGLDEFNVHICDEGIDYLNQALLVASTSHSSVVFAHPPLFPPNRLPKSWKDIHGRVGIAEVFAEKFFQGAETELTEELLPSNREILILLLPMHLLGLQSYGKWRTSYFSKHSAIIIEHNYITPWQSHNNYMTFATVVIRREAGPIKFFKLPNEDISSEVILKDLKKLIEQPAGKSRFGYVYQDSIEPGYPCTYDFYSEETERLRNESSLLGEKVHLDQIADIILPFRPQRNNSHLGDQESKIQLSDFNYIKARSITKGGQLLLEDTETYKQTASNVTFLQEGDILLRQIVIQSEDRGFIAAVCNETEQPIAFGHGIIVVRPKPLMTLAQKHVLYSYLRSPVAGKLNVVKGAGLQINPSMLREYPVPLAGKELCSAMDALVKARESFKQWEQECLKAEQTIVMMTDAEDAKVKLITAGQLARQRRMAGEQVEELDFRIRTQFPHPIAYLWREAQIGASSPFLKFKNILKTAESVTCFMATIAMVMARHLQIDIQYLNTISSRLAGRSGTNFGDWFAIIEEVNSAKSFRHLTSSQPFFGVTQLFASSEFEVAVRSLMQLRNDESHGRLPHSSIKNKEVESALTELKAVFAAIETCTDWKLIQVIETNYDSILRQTNYRYLDLTGDHPLPPEQQGLCSRNDLERSSLYLIDQLGELHLLRPLIQYLECPECHQMSTFYLDTYGGCGNSVGLKSFERGTIRNEEVADTFRAVGLIN